ncbi:MAG: hypothetical protein A2008_01065 [Candidatus Wallbacteria bacterium GWC2_49_35]|uniref:Pyruvate/ketoisovalerate oxidoreductase catalytic domain-containing protein n=1 Tax=Candidatus Wallbacteria bacterium GWC2_49_35 TaxID=1817813 RepID=A0A1F7WXQ8_9BACT|nr:MAG: hypothetical protein A2008_01065 [Candidatus Wallbacteria bacterium GWC2_49_35]HBC75672.1 hypothetical protein [Candidatus Wallbacteria bacterium]
MSVKNIIITGIGGQGVLYLSAILRGALARKYGAISGYDNRGGAQRLGHVASVIRFDDADGHGAGRAPAIDFADFGCDFAIALEASELLKFNRKFGTKSVIITDEFIMPPTNVRRAGDEYFKFDQIKTHFEGMVKKFIHGDLRNQAAGRFGNHLTANLLALGCFIKESGGLLSCGDFKNACSEKDLKTIESLMDKGAVKC